MMNKPIKTGKKKSISSQSQVQQKWVGEILAKKQKKVYKDNGFKGNIYYKLKVKDQEDQIRAVFVYPNLVSKEIFSTIQKDNYIYKKYLFFGERAKWGLVLHNWQEINAYEKK